MPLYVEGTAAMVGGPEQAAQDSPAADARELMRTIAHNLRTPLAVIKGCTDMLLTHGDEELDDARRRELLLMAAANVDRLAEAIVWLEDRMERLTSGQTIRLPEGPNPHIEGGHHRPDQPRI